jgi:4-hydroxy-3-methylbut-2-enyl diphosphate reductase
VSTGPLVVTALRTEYAALLKCGLHVERCGMGETRARRWASECDTDAAALAVVGVAGGLDPALRAGDVVIATEVHDEHAWTALSDVSSLVADLRREGLPVSAGPIACSQHLMMDRAERARLHVAGALCVDMESAAIAQAWAQRSPLAVVRVVVDTVDAGLLHPATVPRGIRALRTIRRIAPALGRWCDTIIAER